MIDILKQFAKQEVTAIEAMRALTEHDGWFVPVGLMPEEQNVFDKLVAFDNEGKTPTRLWIFTDETRAHAANGKGFAMGVYCGPVAGEIVFRLFPDKFEAGVDVNTGSPIEETWHISREAFPLARAWAGAIAVERAPHNNIDDMVARLRGYDDYLLLIGTDNALVRLPVGEDNAPYALAFTAPDWQEAFMRQVTDEQRTKIRSVSMRATDLFGQLERLGVHGVILNVSAPPRARKAVPLEIARLVAQPG